MSTTATTQPFRLGLRGPVFWGVAWGSRRRPHHWPCGGWTPPPSTRLGLAVIAPIYIGLAVGGDGRRKVIAVETGVASGFIIIAAAAITGTPWLLVIGLAGHGLKDLWQHRTHFVANTRWWPPFCLVVDFVVAAVIAFEIVAGLDFH